MSCGTDDGLMVSWSPSLTDQGGNRYGSTGQFDDSDGDPYPHWTLAWNMTVDPDPFINGAFALTNNTNLYQTYTLIVQLPIAPAITPSSLMGGSMGGSLTDANFDALGGLSTAGPSPLYAGMIDGVQVLPIYAHPSSWSFAFAGQTITIPQINSGLPGPTIPGPAVLNNIGIQHRFTLSPGDSVSFTSFFVVQVPEPATLSVLALGGLALLRRRSR